MKTILITPPLDDITLYRYEYKLIGPLEDEKLEEKVPDEGDAVEEAIETVFFAPNEMQLSTQNPVDNPNKADDDNGAPSLFSLVEKTGQEDDRGTYTYTPIYLYTYIYRERERERERERVECDIYIYVCIYESNMN